MTWSYRVATVAGTAVKIHLTFLLLLFYVYDAWSQGGGAAALTMGVFLLGLFGCVLLHEFGHILMARRYGVRTPDVILLPIGGVARLERIPEEPRQELMIALAGPAVTLAIAVSLYLLLLLLGLSPSLSALDPLRGGLLPELMAVNVWLLVFNLIPAFPMDGGRVLRALLATRLGHLRGTRIAARVGQGIALLFGLAGLGFFTGLGLPPNVILTLIGVFVFFGAGAEVNAVETRSAGRGLRVAQMMVTQFQALPVFATLEQAERLLLTGEQREFPVVDNDGRVEGLLTRDRLLQGISRLGPGGGVAAAMAEAPLVGPDLPFDQALSQLRESGLPALPVADTDRRLLGLLTMDNISDWLLVRRAHGEE